MEVKYAAEDVKEWDSLPAFPSVEHNVLSNAEIYNQFCTLT